jgi:parallel beta-helix repeat protein
MITSIIALAIPILSPSTVHADLTSHAPIYIDGNAGFTPENGVNGGGLGIESDPYIIENWVISASSASGIDIRNTTAYFIIRNCLVENGGSSYAGIYFDNVRNGKIDNTCENKNYYGIHIQGSDNNIISNNTCENNGVSNVQYKGGIYLDYSYASGGWLIGSDNNILDNNTCKNNTGYGSTGFGIRLDFAHNNTLTNNTCENNAGYGILLEDASFNNTLTNNTCENNKYYGIYLYHQVWNNRIDNNIVESNSNGGITLSDNADNNLVSNNIVENNGSRGIYIRGNSDNNLVSNNIVENSYDGVILGGSDNNRVSNNIVKNNSDWGISLGGSNNLIENNIVENNYYGIYLVNSYYNTLTNNIVENNGCGIRNYSFPYRSDYNRIYHNNFINNAAKAYDECSNYWDNGYPSGGNYWSDYTGVDDNRGPNQDIPGPDGMGDSPYNISGGSNRDHYPLMNPWPYIKTRVVVNLAISTGYQIGMPGTTLTYTVTVNNFGAENDNYDLSISDNAVPSWGPTLDNYALGPIPPGENRTTTLSVTIPENAQMGEEDVVTVTATSQENENVTDNASCIARSATISCELSIDPGFSGGNLPGENTTFTVWVKNTSDAPLFRDNYTLTASDNLGWNLWIENIENVLTGDNGKATLTVTIPENAQMGEEDVITVTATSHENENVTDNASCIARSATISCELSIDPRITGNLRGENTTFTVWVKNTSDAPLFRDNYTLTASDNLGWNLWIENIENVLTGDNGKATLTVTIPENAVPGTLDNITVTATSQAYPSINAENYCTVSVFAGPILNLVTGWNLVSFPVASENDTPAKIFAGQTYYIWRWSAENKKYVNPPSNQPVELGVGYWIWVGYDQTVTTSGVPVDNYSIGLKNGWNLVGFPVTNANTTPANLFASQTYYIWKWDAVLKKYVNPPSNNPVELKVGYWIWVDHDQTVTVPL